MSAITEWRVVYPDSPEIDEFVNERAARDFAAQFPGAAVQSRKRTRVPDVVTEWTADPSP